MSNEDNNEKNPSTTDQNTSEETATEAATTTTSGQSFGQWMLEQRQKKSITLEEIASVTKIQLGMLKNIEADDYSRLPAPAFIRGFIVNFARFVGVDEHDAVERFRAQLKKSDGVNSLSAYLGTGSGGIPTSVASPTGEIPRKEITQSGIGKGYNRPSAAMDMDAVPLFTPKRLIIALVALALIVITAILFNIGSQQSESTSENTETNAATSTEISEGATASESLPEVTPAPTQVATTATPIPTPPPSTPVAAEPAKPAKVAESVPTEDAASTFSYHLKLRGLDSSWVNVRVDQKGSQGTMLEKGQTKDFYGNQRITVALSDAGGVEISWNNKWYQPAGYRGDVKSLNLPDDLVKLKER
ncbi:MAG TPA: RodZ domain-containing protein [Bdellovibrionota bacterium]|jgi:cytoskeleton protein RodZ|nr:RodZ domain-containing protein [Bdellovibrionota bacterium]